MMGLVISCIFIFVSLFSLVYYDYMDNVFTNRYIDYDVKCVTAGDYTFEFEISENQYNHFKKHYI